MIDKFQNFQHEVGHYRGPSLDDARPARLVSEITLKLNPDQCRQLHVIRPEKIPLFSTTPGIQQQEYFSKVCNM